MKILLLFSNDLSLKEWNKLGFLKRELNFYKRLSEKGLEFYFLTYGSDNEGKYLQNSKIKVLPIGKYVRSNNKLIRFLKILFIPIKFRRYFNNIDIIKTNQISGSWIGIIAKVLYNKKLILRGGYEWLRNFQELSQINDKIKLFKFLKSYIFIFLTELIGYKFADRVILTNEGDINYVIKIFKLRKKKLVCIPNYIDTDLFKPLTSDRNKHQILYIGRLNPEKNLINLIKAFSKLTDFHLDIIGTGILEQKIKILTNKLNLDINLLGVFPNSALPKIINQHYIVVLPSFFECNPKSLLEAMSCGIPCIGTNVRGINSIINHQINGLLCNLSSKAIRNSILSLTQNEELYNKISHNARKFIINNFSIDYIVNKEFRLYNEVIINQKCLLDKSLNWIRMDKNG